MTVVYVAEVAAYDTVGASAVTLYYATHGFTTGPSDTPAHTFIDGRITQVLNVARHAFAPGATAGRSVVGFGDLRLANGDGALDALTTDYALDGRTLTIRRGTLGAAYPSAFSVVVEGLTMEQVEVGREEVVIRVKDATFPLDGALQPTTFDGDNVLPDGLEGTAEDLKGKPKPLAYGVVKNATLPLVNSAKLIYQLRDGEVQAVSAAYDAGIRLGDRRYATVALGGKAKFARFFDEWPDEPQASLFGSTDGRCLIYALDLWIAGTSDGIYTSPDFVTWTQREVAANIVPNGLAFDGTTVVAVGNSGAIYTSTNGTSWTSRTSGVAVALTSAAFGASTFTVAGNEGTLITSPTGTTWTPRTSPYAGASYLWNGVTFDTDNALFVVVGFDSGTPAGIIATSPTGATWTARTSGTALRLQSVAAGNGQIIAVGPDTGTTAVTLRSSTGVTWEVVAQTARDAESEFGAIHEVIFDGDRFVAATSYGSIIATELGSTWEVWYRHPGAVGANTTYQHTGIAFKDFSPAGTFADLTELEDDDLAPEPGTFKWVSHADGSYIRLGSSPLGEITADFTVGATSADRTAAQVWADILTKAGYTSADWVAGDLTTLDAADNSEIGLFLSDETSIASALDAVASTVGAWWGPRASDGKFRLVQWLAPTGTAALTITADDLAEPLTMLPTTDDGRGLPSFRTTLRYAPNWTVQTSGLAAGVTDARRAYLAAQWREASDEDAAVQTAHLLANATVEETLYTVEADAVAEAQRRQTLRGVRRRRFRAVLEMNAETLALDVGAVVTLTHPRFGLSSGADFRILGIEPDHARHRLTLNLWG